MPPNEDRDGMQIPRGSTRATQRHFSLSDAMILIVSFAFIMALHKWAALGYRRQIFDDTLSEFVEAVLDAFVLSATMLCLRLRRPRPRRTALFRQPGAVACAIAVAIPVLLGLLVGIAGFVQTELVQSGVVAGKVPKLPWRQAPGFSLFRFGCWSCRESDFFTQRHGHPHYAALILLTGAVIGAAVTVAWLMLAISGRRRPESGWIDRSGRLLGTFWVLNFWVLAGAFLTSFF